MSNKSKTATSVLARLAAQVTLDEGYAFIEATDGEIAIVNEAGQRVTVGDVAFAERILGTKLPEGWHFDFNGLWYLSRSGNHYLEVDICEHLTSDEIQTLVNDELALDHTFWTTLYAVELATGYSLTRYDGHLGLSTPEGHWMALPVNGAMDLDEMQRVTDCTIRYHRDFGKVALEIAGAWRKSKLPVPAVLLGGTSKFDTPAMSESSWAAAVALEGELHGVDSMIDIIKTNREAPALARAAGLSVFETVHLIIDSFCSKHRHEHLHSH